MFKKEKTAHVVMNSLAAAVAAILVVGTFFISKLVLGMTVNQSIFFGGLFAIGTVVPVGLNIKKFKPVDVVGIGLMIFFALVFSAMVVNYQIRLPFAAAILFIVLGGFMIGGTIILSEFAKEYSQDRGVFFTICLVEAVAIALPIILVTKLSN